MTQAEVLNLWDAGRQLGPLDRAVLMASASSVDHLSAADWPLGTRNRGLARLHCDAFGGMLRGYTVCHGCGEQLEFEFDGRNVAAPPATMLATDHQLIPVGKWIFRLPTSRDLAIAAAEAGEQAAAQRLLACCYSGLEPATNWTDEDLEIIGQRLSEADPFAEIMLHFNCPACSASFDESLDLGDFVWAEIEAQATRIFQEVHALATAYGWSESEILALNPARRKAYVELVQA
jgi:hypothetical protein